MILKLLTLKNLIMIYIKGIPTEVKVLVKHRNHTQKIEGMISYDNNNSRFLFHNEKLHGENAQKFGYSKSWYFNSMGNTFTEGIQSIELLELNYEIF